ncbi:class I SAM-dependent methyltransferase [Roseitranquillus sediminis]|uniref:class I SAM-dependent methyltransferase n=1 Tax=Roseitranquillus sediminis TaxID=2809051 RepID=UPI001D0CC8CB|nr:methyltransferase [Roseitranquillus sediminis]MBM9593253.1 class I SAM-dependent methyltransferase [Roseitranquillus sediminis]
MSSQRLSLALDQGALVLPPDGAIALFRPPAGTEVAELPRDRLEIVHGFRPDHDWFAARAWRTVAEAGGPYAAAVVFLPRAREQARGMIAEACRLTQGRVAVDGQKTDGIDGILREVRARTEVGEVISKAHGKLFAFASSEVFRDWESAPREVEGFATAPGVFSADGPDPGSVALAEVLPALGGEVADLGAGWGYLGRAILRSDKVRSLHAVEAEHAALACARANLDDPRVIFHWADATRFRPPQPLDAVVTNPPFHQGRRPDPSIGRGFVAAAAGMLKPSGQFWMVANRHLPYETTLNEAFRTVREVAGDGGFKVIQATHPRRTSR